MAKRKDLTGMIFGRLMVKEYSYTNKDKRAVWKCLCTCGKEVCVQGKSLLNSDTKSCGCYNREQISKRFRKDLIGKTFEKLTVIEYSHSTKTGRAMWVCKCDCGNTTIVCATDLLGGNTKSCGCMNESVIACYLKKYYKKFLFAVPEYKEFKNPKTGYYLPYDIFIPKYKAYIEIQGRHHYGFIEYWHKNKSGFEHQIELDKLKKQHATENGMFIEIDLREIKTTKEAIEYINNRL